MSQANTADSFDPGQRDDPCQDADPKPIDYLVSRDDFLDWMLDDDFFELWQEAERDWDGNGTTLAEHVAKLERRDQAASGQ